MDLLKTMLQNRKVNTVASTVGNMSLGPPQKSQKQEIIDSKPKHKKLKEYFESVIERCVDEDDESD